LGTIIGVVVILAGVVGVNIYMRLENLQAKFDKMRRAYEQAEVEKGTELLDWELLRKTKGSLRSGPKFDGELLPKADQMVNLMGFMTPIDQFREATHFMLLPLPIECYFCQAPPLRDVMLVRLVEGQTVDLVEEPVLISGRLVLSSGTDEKFFYTLEDASRTTIGETTQKRFDQQHRQEGATMGRDLLSVEDHAGQQPAMPEESLLPPVELPGVAPSEPAPAP
jgi:hypothetical protein